MAPHTKKKKKNLEAAATQSRRLHALEGQQAALGLLLIPSKIQIAGEMESPEYIAATRAQSHERKGQNRRAEAIAEKWHCAGQEALGVQAGARNESRANARRRRQ
jgi:hypothetical protein